MVIKGKRGWFGVEWVVGCGESGAGEEGKRERITTGGKGRGKIRSEIGKVTGMVADAPTTDSLCG